jgi:hypothetical protein
LTTNPDTPHPRPGPRLDGYPECSPEWEFVAGLAERHGVRPPDARPVRVLDPGQSRWTLDFLAHRAGGPATPEWDEETLARSSAMLRAERDSPYLQRSMGMTEDGLEGWEDNRSYRPLG